MKFMVMVASCTTNFRHSLPDLVEEGWFGCNVSPQVISLASDRCALASAFINSGQSGDITDATVPFWPIRRYYALWGHAIGDRGAAFSSCIWGSSKLS